MALTTHVEALVKLNTPLDFKFGLSNELQDPLAP